MRPTFSGQPLTHCRQHERCLSELTARVPAKRCNPHRRRASDRAHPAHADGTGGIGVAPRKKEKAVSDRHVVVISRHWNNPEIKISVTDVLLAISMPLPEFTKALATELGAGNGQIEKLNTAVNAVCS